MVGGTKVQGYHLADGELEHVGPKEDDHVVLGQEGGSRNLRDLEEQFALAHDICSFEGICNREESVRARRWSFERDEPKLNLTTLSTSFAAS